MAAKKCGIAVAVELKRERRSYAATELQCERGWSYAVGRAPLRVAAKQQKIITRLRMAA
jgi:hypothetical protein